MKRFNCLTLFLFSTLSYAPLQGMYQGGFVAPLGTHIRDDQIDGQEEAQGIAGGKQYFYVKLVNGMHAWITENRNRCTSPARLQQLEAQRHHNHWWRSPIGMVLVGAIIGLGGYLAHTFGGTQTPILQTPPVEPVAHNIPLPETLQQPTCNPFAQFSSLCTPEQQAENQRLEQIVKEGGISGTLTGLGIKVRQWLHNK